MIALRSQRDNIHFAEVETWAGAFLEHFIYSRAETWRNIHRDFWILSTCTAFRIWKLSNDLRLFLRIHCWNTKFRFILISDSSTSVWLFCFQSESPPAPDWDIKKNINKRPCEVLKLLPICVFMIEEMCLRMVFPETNWAFCLEES